MTAIFCSVHKHLYFLTDQEENFGLNPQITLPYRLSPQNPANFTLGFHASECIYLVKTFASFL